jgi:hypothetical protein
MARKDVAPAAPEVGAFPVPEAIRSEAEVLSRFMSIFCTKLLQTRSVPRTKTLEREQKSMI